MNVARDALVVGKMVESRTIIIPGRPSFGHQELLILERNPPDSRSMEQSAFEEPSEVFKRR